MAATTARRAKTKSRTATHRPATRNRRFKHDDLVAVDLFSGFGGLTRGIEMAGFTTIMAANHNSYKVEVHEANHPHAEHWIADLVDPDAADYHSARDLPAADILVAGVSCTNHTVANSQKAYAQRASLFDLDDPEFEARVTRSERDRATANCVLAYAGEHHPRVILVECTTELTSWGPAIPGKPKVGDGTTYRWWLKQFKKLNYRHKVLYLNSMFFGVPQSRNRIYIVFWDASLPTPDLEHRPPSWCGRCSEILPAVWTWKTGIPPTGSVSYGKQYCYRCPRCRNEVVPPMSPSLHALDLTNLGTRIGDKPIKRHRDGSIGPYAATTMARAERCRRRFAEFPAVLMPAKATRGSERHLGRPMATQTSQQETALLTAGAPTGTLLAGQVMAAHRHNGDGQPITRPMDTVTTTHEKALLLAVNNFQGAPRGADEPLPTQPGSETLGLLSAGVVPLRKQGAPRSLNEPLATQAGSETLSLFSAGVVPFRRNTVPTVHPEAMPTVTSDQIPGLLTAVGLVQKNEGVDRRVFPVSEPLRTLVASSANQGLLFSGWHGHDGTAKDATDWHHALADVPLEDCYFRMLAPHEIGRGCGFDVDFPDGHRGDFVVWGSARDQVDGFGNAVSPQVGWWISLRLRAILHGEATA
ncbi:DNA cytosine methyltransferase [Verrucosispora sp. TAA-831]|uniref:DNA cytosine methyltransferase n=1 Tax=Verrucosispora sp. TAA-831 TaxID=3422227 RepID=UPI003D6FE6F1